MLQFADLSYIQSSSKVLRCNVLQACLCDKTSLTQWHILMYNARRLSGNLTPRPDLVSQEVVLGRNRKGYWASLSTGKSNDRLI